MSPLCAFCGYTDLPFHSACAFRPHPTSVPFSHHLLMDVKNIKRYFLEKVNGTRDISNKFSGISISKLVGFRNLNLKYTGYQGQTLMICRIHILPPLPSPPRPPLMGPQPCINLIYDYAYQFSSKSSRTTCQERAVPTKQRS